jgi:hypothetical protein
MEQPTEITLCNLQVIVMPNGEVICLGKRLGWLREFKEVLSIIKDK